jgi:hypothetical protein
MSEAFSLEAWPTKVCILSTVFVLSKNTGAACTTAAMKELGVSMKEI